MNKKELKRMNQALKNALLATKSTITHLKNDNDALSKTNVTLKTERDEALAKLSTIQADTDSDEGAAAADLTTFLEGIDAPAVPAVVPPVTSEPVVAQ